MFPLKATLNLFSKLVTCLLAILIILGGVNVEAFADSITLSGSVTANDSVIGAASWADTDKSIVSDNVYSSAYVNAAGSYYLKTTGFGFSIPTGSTINGIVVTVEHRGGGGMGSVADNSIKLVKAGAAIGTDKVSATTWTQNVDETFTYGTAVDLWGTTWTPAEINSAAFGFDISGKKTGGPAPTIALQIDAIAVTIYYTLGAVSTPTLTSTPMPTSTLGVLTPTATTTPTNTVLPSSTPTVTRTATPTPTPTATPPCPGYVKGFLPGSVNSYQFYELRDWDTCLFGPNPVFEGGHYSDGHVKYRENGNGTATIIESTGNMPMFYTLGATVANNALPLTVGAVVSDTQKNNSPDVGCGNPDGSLIAVVLSGLLGPVCATPTVCHPHLEPSGVIRCW